MWIPLRSAKMNGFIFGIPAAGLVAEVDSGLEQLPHRNGRHGGRPPVGSFLRGPRRRGPVGLVGLAGTVPVGTVRVCAPRRVTRALDLSGGSGSSPGPGGSVARVGSAVGRRGRSAAMPVTSRADDAASGRPARPRRGRTAAAGAGSGSPSGQRPTVEQAVRGGPDPRSLAVVDGLLGQPELAAGAPADLDDDERRRRTRVDRHEVELVATDMDVPGQDGPASLREPVGDERLGGITRLLGRRPPRSPGRSAMAASSQATLIRHVSRPSADVATVRPDRQLQRREVERVEHRVVGHDRHQLARQAARASRRRPPGRRAGRGRAGRRRASAGAPGTTGGGTASARARGSPSGARAWRSPGCAPSRSPGSAAASRSIIRSRTTLATTDAHAIE